MRGGWLDDLLGASGVLESGLLMGGSDASVRDIAERALIVCTLSDITHAH